MMTRALAAALLLLSVHVDLPRQLQASVPLLLELLVRLGSLGPEQADECLSIFQMRLKTRYLLSIILLRESI